MIKPCKECKKPYEGHFNAKYCSKACEKEYNRKKSVQKHLRWEEDGIECQICHKYKTKNLISHLSRHHKIKAEDYAKTYNSPYLIGESAELYSNRLKGSKNPAYQHGGKYSPFSENFIYKTETSIQDTITKTKLTRAANPEREPTRIEYYLSQGYDAATAQKMLAERQSTFSLAKCKEKYGDKEGKRIWLARQAKWHKSYRKTNYSRISQELFWRVLRRIDVNLWSNFRFATLHPLTLVKDTSTNHEKQLVLSIGSIKLDFVDVAKQRIIEFDGSYWHKKGKVDLKDQVRDEETLAAGFTTLRIAELDYKKYPDEMINKCLQFLGY